MTIEGAGDAGRRRCPKLTEKKGELRRRFAQRRQQLLLHLSDRYALRLYADVDRRRRVPACVRDGNGDRAQADLELLIHDCIAGVPRLRDYLLRRGFPAGVVAQVTRESVGLSGHQDW